MIQCSLASFSLAGYNMQSVLLSFATMISTDFVCVCVLGAVIISRYFRSLRLFCLFRFSDLPSVSNIVFF